MSITFVRTNNGERVGTIDIAKAGDTLSKNDAEKLLENFVILGNTNRESAL